MLSASFAVVAAPVANATVCPSDDVNYFERLLKNDTQQPIDGFVPLPSLQGQYATEIMRGGNYANPLRGVRLDSEFVRGVTLGSFRELYVRFVQVGAPRLKGDVMQVPVAFSVRWEHGLGNGTALVGGLLQIERDGGSTPAALVCLAKDSHLAESILRPDMRFAETIGVLALNEHFSKPEAMAELATTIAPLARKLP